MTTQVPLILGTGGNPQELLGTDGLRLSSLVAPANLDLFPGSDDLLRFLFGNGSDVGAVHFVSNNGAGILFLRANDEDSGTGFSWYTNEVGKWSFGPRSGDEDLKLFSTSAGDVLVISHTDGTASLFRVVIEQTTNNTTALLINRATDTSPTGNFIDCKTAAGNSRFTVGVNGAVTCVREDAAGAVESMLTLTLAGDAVGSLSFSNGTSTDATFNPKIQGVQKDTGPGLNFGAQSTTDTGTSPVLLFLAQIGSGVVATRPCVEFRNLTTPIVIYGANYNVQLKGGATSPALAAAAADTVSMVGVDNGAGNRELQIQPETGGLFALGNNSFRRVPSANREVDHVTSTVNTTDATQTTLATVAITANRTYTIEARVNARRTGGSGGTADDGASYVRRATYTTKSGTVTLMGSVQTIGTDAEDQAAWDVTLDISTTNVRVRVTGAANNNVTWMGDLTIQFVGS